MDSVTLPFVGIFVGVLGLTQLAWHVAVIVLLVKIWGRVKDLPRL